MSHSSSLENGVWGGWVRDHEILIMQAFEKIIRSTWLYIFLATFFVRIACKNFMTLLSCHSQRQWPRGHGARWDHWGESLYVVIQIINSYMALKNWGIGEGFLIVPQNCWHGNLSAYLYLFYLVASRLSCPLQSNWNQIVDSFDEMSLRETLLRGIYAYGFEKPSAIQQRAIVPCIKGK